MREADTVPYLLQANTEIPWLGSKCFRNLIIMKEAFYLSEILALSKLKSAIIFFSITDFCFLSSVLI